MWTDGRAPQARAGIEGFGRGGGVAYEDGQAAQSEPKSLVSFKINK